MPDEPAPTPRGSYAKGVARRQEILDRAIEVYARRGSDKTSLRAIAEEVGVTHAALKHYFGSLEELLVAVYRESERRSDARGPVDPEVTPVELMRRWTESNREVPGLVQLYSTLVAAALEEGHEAAHDFATERFARVRSDLVERVRHNQAAGLIRADVAPDAVAALVVAASDGLQTQWLLDPAAPQDAALALLELLLASPETR
ncbi:TetR/AcrR family transcriptional regulator [Microbacterium allomyrinae]|uniref:TetR/AcrR family transcriptional regulator n=1 Tax=Microbacterium allomyrinae TaxID=2830666 RepID=A0A9X1LXB8_9MICO|nr:TetR/AcrR family transcriptional regulator [Microbacterium allomyrinae]MCC2033742.1 TetR/AcrR family transcriptional regulator [Microbacterium allomyrinae]